MKINCVESLAWITSQYFSAKDIKIAHRSAQEFLLARGRSFANPPSFPKWLFKGRLVGFPEPRTFIGLKIVDYDFLNEITSSEYDSLFSMNV